MEPAHQRPSPSTRQQCEPWGTAGRSRQLRDSSGPGGGFPPLSPETACSDRFAQVECWRASDQKKVTNGFPLSRCQVRRVPKGIHPVGAEAPAPRVQQGGPVLAQELRGAGAPGGMLLARWGQTEAPAAGGLARPCLLYTSPSPRDL